MQEPERKPILAGREISAGLLRRDPGLHPIPPVSLLFYRVDCPEDVPNGRSGGAYESGQVNSEILGLGGPVRA
ncbi:hypothetical protein VTN96DRAFT_6835 [Rasamsonia emersonii]